MTTGVAAYVDGGPVPLAEVDERMALLRATAWGSRLPDAHSAEGRNARRWVVQLLCAERLVRAELIRRKIPLGARPSAVRIDRALAVGGVAAAVLAAVPEARLLVDALGPAVDEAAVRGYYDRNPDLFADRGVPFETARPEIVRTLGGTAADRAFSAWLEQRMSTAVTLAPGFEHPADPSHADATHRH